MTASLVAMATAAEEVVVALIRVISCTSCSVRLTRTGEARMTLVEKTAATLASAWPKVASMPLTKTLLLSCLAGLVAVVVVKSGQMYRRRRRMPPGPFPWPLIGSVTSFKREFAHVRMKTLTQKHGPVFTLWVSHTPIVFVTDPALGLQVLKKHTFAGRPQFGRNDMFEDGSVDIVLADFGKEWEALRRVGHSAARKYAVNPVFARNVVDVVDRIVQRVGQQPFDSNEILTLMLVAILSQAAFGQTFDFEDPEFKRWLQIVDAGQDVSTIQGLVSIFPILRLLFRGTWRELLSRVEFQRNFVGKRFQKAIDGFDTNHERDSFCAAILTAKREAEAEEHWMLPHLHPNNLKNVVQDLFGAGSETTKTTLRWLLLLAARHEDMQQRMRQEVDDVIGQQEPAIEHRALCPFVAAFVAETMRFRPFIPTVVPHKATVDEQVSGYTIPKDTVVITSLWHSLNDQDSWTDPDTFRPQRFLSSSGSFESKPNANFIPFSAGRRACPGDKVALNNLFLVVARLLQLTSGISVVGGVTDALLQGDESKSAGWLPASYCLQLSLRQKALQ